MRRQSICAACILGMCLSLILAASPAQAAGAQAKALTLPALLDMVKLNKGKVVVVNFFATWCPPCKEEIPGLVALTKAFPADKLAIIGVSVDQDQKLVQPFTKQMKINYPVFFAGKDVVESYGVRTIPHNVIYDVDGQMAANVTGFVTEADLKEYINILLEQKKK